MTSKSCCHFLLCSWLLLLTGLTFPSIVDGSLSQNNNRQYHPQPEKSSLHDESTATTTSMLNTSNMTNEKTMTLKVTLPRVEVQFLCTHDIRSDFDVSTTFDQFYKEMLEPTFESNTTTLSNRASLKTELYTYRSMSDVHDIRTTESYYSTCDQSSSTMLATMDVRGYVHLYQEKSQKDYEGDNATMTLSDISSTRSDIQARVQQLLRQVDQTAIQEFFQKHVCTAEGSEEENSDSIRNMPSENDSYDDDNNNNTTDNNVDAILFFKAKIRSWNVYMSPPPPSTKDHYPYPSTKDHKHFNHNLQLLCDHGVDIVYPNYHKEPFRGYENVPSLIVGIIVGILMIAMIYKELHSKENHLRSQRQRQRPTGNTTAMTSSRPSTRNDGYTRTATQDVEDGETTEIV